tara:strand:- start:330 stop:497 length:168 start_codon:yes stop_codon:yes gene_type:complete
MNPEEKVLKLKMLINVLSAMRPKHNEMERILTNIMTLIDELKEDYERQSTYGKDY